MLFQIRQQNGGRAQVREQVEEQEQEQEQVVIELNVMGCKLRR